MIKIGMVDLQKDDRWIERGKSTAWNWQQDCLSQWLPGSRHIFHAVGFVRVESCPTQAVLPLVGLAADKVIRDRYKILWNDRRLALAHFPLPKPYTGEWRVDTHPRLGRDVRLMCIDAVYKEQGRQLHLIDIRNIVG